MKIDLKEVTFIIPTRIDSIDRLKNIYLTLRYLNKFLNTNIYVLEVTSSGKDFKLQFLYKERLCELFSYKAPMQFFEKSFLLNELLKQVETPVTCIYDTDVLLQVYQYPLGVKLILDDKFDVVVSFDGRIKEVPLEFHGILRKSLSLSCYENENFVVKSHVAQGGCVFLNTNKFKEIGGMNENMHSLGGQDDELIERARILGLRIFKMNEPIFHLEHNRPPESAYGCKGTSTFREGNLKELTKIGTMSKEDMKELIKTWRKF